MSRSRSDFHGNGIFNNNNQDDDGSVFFTHLFSAPLIERKMAEGGSGCVVKKKVDELSYEGERDTLLRTLLNAGKRVRFLSEAANTKSFARAIGCLSGSDTGNRFSSNSSGISSAICGGSDRHDSNRSINSSNTSTSTSTSARSCTSGSGRNCRDTVCRIMHFTGHGVPGQLTFEDRSGELKYVHADRLLAMLQCRKSRVAGQQTRADCSAASSSFSSRGRHSRQAVGTVMDNGVVNYEDGYAPFEDLSVPSDDDDDDDDDDDYDYHENHEREERARADAPRAGLQLVFLSSCHSQSVAECFIQAIFVFGTCSLFETIFDVHLLMMSQGVRHVIAVRQDAEVLDHKAADFAESFYTSLLRGDTVLQAFSLGSARLGVSDTPEEEHKFLLLPRNGNHDIPVFERVPPGEFVDATPPKPSWRWDTVTQSFLGRAVDVQKVVKQMVEHRRCITITGQAGIGKTQVLLKACEYARERHVFGDVFFCRVDKAGRDVDACNWLERGFQLPTGSLGARNMDGAVSRIRAHVRAKGLTRALLVLDGCPRQILMAHERVELRKLLTRLFAALPNLYAAVTMRATSPTARGEIGVVDEKVVVVERLDDLSTAELLTMSCSRNLLNLEMDPNNEAVVDVDGRADMMSVFARSDIVRSLEGHPACVQDLCRCVHEERSLFLRRKELLEEDIPEIKARYAYPDEHATRRLSARLLPDSTRALYEEATPMDAFHALWADIVGQNTEFYGLTEGRARTQAVQWGRWSEALVRYFSVHVPGARDRPLSSGDLKMFAEDATLWKGACPAEMAARQDVDVPAVLMSHEGLKKFWVWFYQATITLRRTFAWSLGVNKHKPGFAGFMKKSTAIALLANAARNTFLIRFSASMPGGLAIHYRSSPRRGVVSVSVQVGPGGELSYDNGPTYHDLVDLALRSKPLLYVYPNTPKTEIFTRPEERLSYTGSRTQPRHDSGSTLSGSVHGAGAYSSGSRTTRGDASGRLGVLRRESGAPRGGGMFVTNVASRRQSFPTAMPAR